MHRDKMAIAWSKWREARDLCYEGLMSKEELLELRTELFKGVAPMESCKKVFDAWYDDYLWDQVDAELSEERPDAREDFPVGVTPRSRSTARGRGAEHRTRAPRDCRRAKPRG